MSSYMGDTVWWRGRGRGGSLDGVDRDREEQGVQGIGSER
jgi:hypothetical protein